MAASQEEIDIHGRQVWDFSFSNLYHHRKRNISKPECVCRGETEGQEMRDLDAGRDHTGPHIGHSWWLLDWDPSRALGGRSLKGLLLQKMLLGSVSDPLCLAVLLQSLVSGGLGQS